MTAAMLRDYAQKPDWRLLYAALERFIDLPPELSMIFFEELSPDSFLWRLFDGKTTYYLYAEDYVPSLEHVKAEILHFLPHDPALEFLPAKSPVAFEDSSPNMSADVHQPPAYEYEFSLYDAPSGYDHVFLLRSVETFEL